MAASSRRWQTKSDSHYAGIGAPRGAALVEEGEGVAPCRALPAAAGRRGPVTAARDRSHPEYNSVTGALGGIVARDAIMRRNAGPWRAEWSFFCICC